MSQPTQDDIDRSGKNDEQQTLLQTPGEKPADPLKTGIQAVSDAPRLEVGPVPLTRVAKYELLKEIGRGGMGVVFKARDVQLNRIVALKMIRSAALANTDELQRFAKEAAAAAQLQHPNIVALYDVSPSDQQPYLSMEYIGGTSLSERVSLGPLSGRRAAQYLELTARAVHYAHTRGIIHRDLKPANVLLDENDQPKVTDFGLAKQMKSRSDQTRTGAVLGTPSYMSPEQAAGSKEIGPSSDVYSLGAILYELTTGKPPFCGETPLATLNLVAEYDPIAPRLLNPALDRDLETICLKCLEKDPKRRYESAESLADDLHRFTAGEPITARRVSVIGRAVKWCQRNRAMTVFSSIFMALCGAFLMYSWYEAYKEKDLREQAERAEKKADEQARSCEASAVSLGDAASPADTAPRRLRWLHAHPQRPAQLSLARKCACATGNGSSSRTACNRAWRSAPTTTVPSPSLIIPTASSSLPPGASEQAGRNQNLGRAQRQAAANLDRAHRRHHLAGVPSEQEYSRFRQPRSDRQGLEPRYRQRNRHAARSHQKRQSSRLLAARGSHCLGGRRSRHPPLGLGGLYQRSGQERAKARSGTMVP